MNKDVVLEKSNKIWEFIRFAIVGAMATGIHYGVYLIFFKEFSSNISYTLGYGVSFVFNFIVSNYFTFKTKPSTKKGIKFIGAHVFNYSLQMILLNLYIYMGISYKIAPFLVYIICIPVNFLLVRKALLK